MTIGRVTNNLLQMSTMNDIRTNNQELLDLQRKLTTGLEINNISDDPLGVNRVLGYEQTISQNEQYVKNLDNGNSLLGITDNSLGDLYSLMTRAKTLILSQINATADDGTREATALELSQILEQVVSTANTQIGNNFIFAGSNTTKMPFELNGNEVIYTGTNEDQLTAISKNIYASVNISGASAFGVLQNQLESSEPLAPSLQDKIFFETEIESNYPGNGFTFTLKDSPTMDIVGKELVISYGQNQSMNVRILDYDPATKAVKVDTQNVPLNLTGGAKVTVTQAATKVSELNGGNGVNLGKFLVNVGSKSYTIDLSKADNISDIKRIIEKNLEGAVEVGFNTTGQGLSIINKSSETLTILEDGRGTVAHELGLLNNSNTRTVMPGETLQGDNIIPMVTRNTMLSSLNNGAGISSLGFRISNGENEQIFTASQLAGLSTVGDLLNLINTSGLSVEAGINENGTGIVLKNRLSGKGVSIDNVMAKGELSQKISSTQFQFNSSIYLGDMTSLIGTQTVIRDAEGNATSRVITAVNGNELTFDNAVDFDAGATIEIYSSRRFLGTVQSASANSLTDAGKFQDAQNILAGSVLKITEGKNAGAVLHIIGSDADHVYFDNPNQIVLDSTDSYEIQTGTANSLGLASLNAGVSVDSLQGAKGLALGQFEITYGAAQTTAVVDVSKAKNMQDVIDAIASATNNTIVATLTNGNSIKLEDSRTSASLQYPITVSELDLGTTAQDLGLIGVDGQAGGEFIGNDLNVRLKETNIFTALYDAIKALRENDLTYLNTAGQELDASGSIILNARAEVGAKLSRFELSKNRLEDQNIFLKELRSNTLDADYIDTVFQFSNKQDVLDASLKAVGALLKTSLLDYL